jgi:predicted Zn-dependent peptidase
VEAVLRVADKVLRPDEKPVMIQRKEFPDSGAVAKKLVEQKLSVAAPLFNLGFKCKSEGVSENLKNQVLDEILCEMIAGEMTPLYRRMYDAGIINATFDTEIMAGRDYMCAIFSGESREPKRVADEIRAEIVRMRGEGIDRETFELARRAIYGRYVGMYARTESVAGLMTATYFAGMDDIYSLLDIVANATPEQLAGRLNLDFDPEKSALSVIHPIDGEETIE